MGVGARDCLFLTVVLGGTGILGAGLVRMSAAPPAQPSNQRKLGPDFSSTVSQVDASFRRRWASRKLMPAALASDLAVMRRLALAVWNGSLAGRDPPLRDPSEARPSRNVARRVAGRPPLCRLPGGAFCSCQLCRYRGRPVSFPSPPFRDMVE